MDVTEIGFTREVHKMLTEVVIHHLSHILKYVPKDSSSIAWMENVDEAHLSTWMDCMEAATLDHALPSPERDHLSSSLDLPPSSVESDYNHLFGLQMRRCSGHGSLSLNKFATTKVLGILEGIDSGLVSHNHPHCQDLLAKRSTLSTT